MKRMNLNLVSLLMVSLAFVWTSCDQEEEISTSGVINKIEATVDELARLISEEIVNLNKRCRPGGRGRKGRRGKGGRGRGRR